MEADGGVRIIRRVNPTYADIADCVKRRHGFVAKTCWIAHTKELNGWPMRTAPNRRSDTVRKVPCPPNKQAAIEDCLRRLSAFRKKPKVRCPHCGGDHEFGLTRLKSGVWPCNGQVLSKCAKDRIRAHLTIRIIAGHAPMAHDG